MIRNQLDRDLFKGNAPDNDELCRRLDLVCEQIRLTLDKLIDQVAENTTNITALLSVTTNSLVTVRRYTTTTTVKGDDFQIAGDTDTGDITLTLLPGKTGKELRIVNTGTSGNRVTVKPNGSEKLLGKNDNFYLADQEALIIVYYPTEGWL